jgi:uncharacterized membrane protein
MWTRTALAAGPGLFQDVRVTSVVLLALAVFTACAVEMVEALTIVVAVGLTRGWRSALEGAVVAVVVLAALVASIGLPLVHLVPLDTLRVIVGALLLVFGLGWLRKAILRASGHKALHDEDKIFAETVDELRLDGTEGDAATGAAGARPARPQRDAAGFVVAFKGVFLEGTEVVLIVLTLGASSHRLPLAAGAAAAALVIVTGVGIVVARQLSEVPENTMKLVVGLMLTTFGVFWLGEGVGVRWPSSDLSLLWLLALFALETALAVGVLRRLAPAPEGSGP